MQNGTRHSNGMERTVNLSIIFLINCRYLNLVKKSEDNFNVCLMMFNATFNNVSVISWRSVLLVEETGGPGKNY